MLWYKLRFSVFIMFSVVKHELISLIDAQFCFHYLVVKRERKKIFVIIFMQNLVFKWTVSQKYVV